MIEINNRTRGRIDERAVREAAAAFLRLKKKKQVGLSIAFIGDKAMRKLNRVYRRRDRTTDVLSFEGDRRSGDFGEIIINYQEIKRQARRLGHSAKQELIFILIHGLLHLDGLDDDTEKKRLAMIAAGEKILKKINIKL